MKRLLAISLLIAASATLATPSPASSPTVVKGEVLEVRNSGGYTYLRLKTRDGETWAAVNRTSVGKGAQVSLENVMTMTDFQSKSLNKTFPTILFAKLGSTTGGAESPAQDLANARAGLGKAPAGAAIKVARASGANARTVEEIVGNVAKLKDKTVTVRGQVVKYNAGILGKNWVHLRDGTGSEAAGTHDILVTTSSETKTGETVTVQGTVRADKDFGAGYAYKVLIEDATLTR